MFASSFAALKARIEPRRRIVPGAKDQPWLKWPLGAPLEADLEWLGNHVDRGALPAVIYSWAEEDEAERRAASKTAVIVYMLDEANRTRHKVVLSGRRSAARLVLTAPFAGWIDSLNTPV